jgi:hypothetical protein
MEKISKLRQVIREELMKEISVTNIARGGNSAATLTQAATEVFPKDMLNKLGRADFDAKNKVLYYTDGEGAAFLTWEKPSSSIIIDGETLETDEWEKGKAMGQDIFSIVLLP